MPASKENEVRFTRSRQALHWFTLATICVVALCSFLAAIFLPEPYGAPELIKKWYYFIPILPVGVISIHFALRCIRHAYIIFSPIGVEVFPFWKPEENLNIIPWQTIHELEIKESFLFIHQNQEQTSGIALSLKPIHKRQLPFLQHLVTERSTSLKEQKNSSKCH